MAVLKQLPPVAPAYVEYLRGRGHDSIICNASEPLETIAIVFDPEQIELVEWQPAWDRVLARVREVRRQQSDATILREAVTDTIARGRRAGMRRR